MKVDGENPFINLGAYIRNVKTRPGGGNTPAEKPKEFPGEDKVLLSPRARQIKESKELLESVPDVREEKVQTLKAQIANGEYNVDSERIASKILKESLMNDFLLSSG